MPLEPIKPVKPRGKPLTSVPKTVRFTDADRRRLAQKWDAAFPKYAGLLRAKAVG